MDNEEETGVGLQRAVWSPHDFVSQKYTQPNGLML
jgi:hypothetical protein